MNKIYRMTLTYVLAVIAPAVAAAAVLAAASGGAGAGAALPAASNGHAIDVGRVLLTIVIVVVAAHGGGALAARLRQPRVVGQAAVGLILGPSLLGQLAPQAAAWLQAPGSAQSIDLLSQLGVILFVFLIGREMASQRQHRTGRQALVIGHAMIAAPFLCGVLAATLLLDRYRPAAIGQLPYALFLGVAMSATALPVLAHILAERKLLTSRVGTLATGSAAVGDATLWCLLAATMCLVQRGSAGATAARLAGALVFAAALWWLLRPVLARLAASRPHSGIALPAILIAGLLLSALVTEHLGLHAIFGAFLFGLVVPQNSVTAQRVTVMAEGLTEWLLLPLFFTAVGSRTHLELLDGTTAVGLCLAVLAIAGFSKLLSAAAASRAVGLSWRESAAIGVAMNCRGLTELLVLNTGLAAGIISPQVFAIFLIMALVTTAVTGPLLSMLGLGRQKPPNRPQTPEPARAAVPAGIA